MTQTTFVLKVVIAYLVFKLKANQILNLADQKFLAQIVRKLDGYKKNIVTSCTYIWGIKKMLNEKWYVTRTL